MLKIKRINESDFERIFVFGDLHGCVGLFDAMLEKINLTKNDLIVILGDSCDRARIASGYICATPSSSRKDGKFYTLEATTKICFIKLFLRMTRELLHVDK